MHVFIIFNTIKVLFLAEIIKFCFDELFLKDSRDLQDLQDFAKFPVFVNNNCTQ